MSNRRNAYICKTCNGVIITVDHDEGVTPFMLLCRATPKCKGAMYSQFYRGALVEGSLPAQFEWRKATYKEYAKASKPMQQHFDAGGLDIHPIAAGGKNE